MSRRDGDRGSSSVELVIITPALLLFLLLAIYAGRIALARQAVHAAAADAARTAAIARSRAVAGTTAQAAARATLTNEGLRCTTTQVVLDLAGFGAPVGTQAAVSATVSCTVDVADVLVPGAPGVRVLTETASSPVDTYRERGP